MSHRSDQQDSDMLAELMSNIVAEPGNKPKPKRAKRSSSHFLRIVGVVLAVLVLGSALAGGGIFLASRYAGDPPTPPSPVSAEIKQKLGLDLYYPTKLPKGFSLTPNSVKTPEDDLVIYEIKDEEGHTIFMTQQQKPEFDFAAFTAVFEDSYKLSTPVGIATLGKVEGTTWTGAILTDNTWIIVNTDYEPASKELENILKSLTPA